MSEKYVINPVTGRSCRVGGKAYRELVKSGKIKNVPFDRKEKVDKPNKKTVKKKVEKKPEKKIKIKDKYDSSESLTDSE